ncbi:hypothetical protein ACTVZO_43315 [Streptomyces sp. IBSNAI002]|uniref:hypothetical protein n=1 Tax=Streptomyces sp. IBSNAI002 TaxID=3457500 RepID=UPI003FD44BEB
MNKQIKRAANIAAATTVIFLTAAAMPAHAAGNGPVNNGLSFLRESAEAIITFAKQVLA